MACLPPRKYILIAIFLALLLYLKIAFQPIQSGTSGTKAPQRIFQPNHASNPPVQPPSPSISEHAGVTQPTPLLGPEEIPAALWFPSSGFDPLLKVPSYNVQPTGHSSPRAPLFIGFTRSRSLLEQTVLSYIAAGWPRADIIVVDNSGTLDANSEGLLSPANPFALNYTLYRDVYGVSILQTPTLLSFAQLMNFYLRTAIAQRWSIFFWSHQDVAVLGDEAASGSPYRSFYQRVLDTLAELGIRNEEDLFAQKEAKKGDWAVKFFAYDWLTLVNVAAWRTIGQWDTFIPYYTADCDAYSRVALHGFTKEDAKVGHIFDVSEAVADPASKFFTVDPAEGLNSKRFLEIKAELDALVDKKWKAKEASRNSWQGSKKGGQGEPWTYDPEGFQTMWWETANHGRVMYKKKWGTEECRLEDHGKKLTDVFE